MPAARNWRPPHSMAALLDSGDATAPSASPSANGAPVYQAQDLRKEYDEGQVKALRGLTFRINSGELVAITGPSGCGKSTLLQMLGALDRPSSGSLLYRGTSLGDLRDPAAYRAKEIGFIFQAFHLLPTLTVTENVQVPMFETKRPLRERERRAIELLKAVGLDHRLNHYPSKLSGGERQRVAIARSLANEPGVLLADEPTGNLDSQNAEQVLELLARIQQERHMTLVLVTHDPVIAARASRVIRMKDGQIISDGAAGAAAQTP
jgi:ABC-type lipoprotein export system ATPase subunit